MVTFHWFWIGGNFSNEMLEGRAGLQPGCRKPAAPPRLTVELLSAGFSQPPALLWGMSEMMQQRRPGAPGSLALQHAPHLLHAVTSCDE